MSEESKESLLWLFQTMTHEDKYEKIMIYLHAMQESEKNLIWLYSVVDDLWSENIEDPILDELYEVLLDITLIWKDYEESGLDIITSKLQDLKEESLKESETKNLLDKINDL